MSSTTRAQPGGFTLIEIMVVIVLVGAVTGAAAWSFNGPLRRARARQAVEQIGIFDASARRAAQRLSGNVEIAIDLSAQRIVRRETRDSEGVETAGFVLPDELRVDSVLTPQGKPSTRDGEIVIEMGPGGISRSYALRLVGDRLDGWLVVAGLSGQMTVITDETQVRSILAGARRDAD